MATLGEALLLCPIPHVKAVGAIIAGVGIIGGAVGTGVNLILDYWDEGGGRELAHAVGENIAEAYQDTAEAVDRVWDSAYEGAGNIFGGIGSGIAGVF